MAKKDFTWVKTKKMQRGLLSMLKKIRKTIETPEKWLKKDFEEDGRYCVIGAVQKVDGSLENEAAKAIALSLQGEWALSANKKVQLLKADIDFVQDDAFMNSVYRFNDAEKTKHRQVLALLDRASRNIAQAL